MSARTPVCSFDQHGIICVYPSIRSVGMDGFTIPSVWKVVSGQRRTHRGVRWRYLTRQEVAELHADIQKA